MTLRTSINEFWHKLMAKQLRNPSGILAKLTGNKMNKANELLYKLTIENLNINDNDHILEIGFGNGRFFNDLHARAKNVRITGIDHSAEMVAEAARINRELYQSGKLNIAQGNSLSLPFEANSFDKIFCINVIYFWDDPARNLKEIHRVLKPGGYFGVGFRPKDDLSKHAFSKFGFTLYTEEECKNLMRSNGFKFVDSYHGESHPRHSTASFESLCLIGEK
jgi:SAM-dependent methyltransferase